MTKNVIHIYGASGSGTTTLAHYISEQEGYFFLDADDYFWLPTDPPYLTKRPATERVERIRADLELCDQAVLSGSLVGWGDELIPLFSLAVRLVTETSVRLERLKKREKERFGSRIEAGGDRHRAHLEFIAWAARYDDGGLDMRSRARHDEWQKQLPCKQLVLNGELPLAENLKRMKGFLL